MSQLKKSQNKIKAESFKHEVTIKVIFDEKRNIEKVRPTFVACVAENQLLGAGEENGERR